MTQRQFESEISKLLRTAKRRVQLLSEASSGSIKLRKIDVKKCVVPEHSRVAHSRLIAPRGWKPRPS